MFQSQGRVLLEANDTFPTQEDWKAAAEKKWVGKKEINKLPEQYVGGRIQSLIRQVYVSTSSQTYL